MLGIDIDYFYYIWRIVIGIVFVLIFIACYYKAIKFVFFQMGNEPRYKNRDGVENVEESKVWHHNCNGQVNEIMKYLIKSL